MRRNLSPRILVTKLIQYLVYIVIGAALFGSLNVVRATSFSGVSYQSYSLLNSVVHVVKIPAKSDRIVTTRVTNKLQPLKSFLKNQEIAAINGGYFDPNNQQTTSYVIKQNKLVADPRLNSRLIDNPDLDIFLGKILNRAEFRRYQCAGKNIYDIVPHRTPIISGCELVDSLGAGPQLLPSNTSIAEAFTAYQNGKLVRNAIGGNSANARSAIAIADEGAIILAMIEQTKPSNSGLSLEELALFLKDLGATKAMNLDGGSSTSLYYRGRTYYGKLNPEGDRVKRSLKSILVVR